MTLQPGVLIKPVLTVDEARQLAERVYGLTVRTIKELDAYDDKNYHIMIEDSPSNSNLLPLWPHGYVLKIMNSLDSKKESLTDAQNSIMLYLGADSPVHAVRLLRFQPGSILHAVDTTPALCREAGEFLARMDTAFEGFWHEAYANHSSIWRLDSATELPKFLFAVKEPEYRDLVSQILERFQQDVVPAMPNLPKGMIHADFNEHNMLVRERDGTWHVDGVLDFGDSHHSCYLFEVALAACYIMLQAKPPLLEPLRAAALLVAGYHRLRPLTPLELQLLQVSICTRLCQSLVLGVYSHHQDPTNTYVLQTAKSGGGWQLMRAAWDIPAAAFIEAIHAEIQHTTAD